MIKSSVISVILLFFILNRLFSLFSHFEWIVSFTVFMVNNRITEQHHNKTDNHQTNKCILYLVWFGFDDFKINQVGLVLII